MKERVGSRGKVQKEERNGGEQKKWKRKEKKRGAERGGKKGGSDALFHFMAVRSETQ